MLGNVRNTKHLSNTKPLRCAPISRSLSFAGVLIKSKNHHHNNKMENLQLKTPQVLFCRYQIHEAPDFNVCLVPSSGPLQFSTKLFHCSGISKTFLKKSLFIFFSVRVLVSIYRPKMFGKRFHHGHCYQCIAIFASLSGIAGATDTSCLLCSLAWCCHFVRKMGRILLFLNLCSLSPDVWLTTHLVFHCCAKLLSRVQLFVTLWTIGMQLQGGEPIFIV